jgi:hypothetical protein
LLFLFSDAYILSAQEENLNVLGKMDRIVRHDLDNLRSANKYFQLAKEKILL